MASGEIDVIPGRVFADEELIDPFKLNQLGTPTLRIKSQSVTSRELADGAITSDKLSDTLEAQLGVQDGSITTNKLVNGAVTAPKLSEDAKIPTGVVIDFAGVNPPDGWLLCYGQLVSRSTYALLFAVLGTTYGAGDGTNFGIPDLRGNVIAGKDNMGGTAAGRLTGNYIGSTTLGAMGGADSCTLSLAQMPYHNHAGVNHTHAFNDYYTTNTGRGNIQYGNDINQGFATLANSTAGADRDLSTGYAGSNGAHYNIQPTIILNKIIRYL